MMNHCVIVVLNVKDIAKMIYNMEAKQVRIGNLFNYMDRLAEVSSIFRTHFSCEEYITRISFGNTIQNNFQPIKLNEEWFLKFGFELIPFRAPSQSCGVDLYYGYNYAILKIGNKTELILRYKDDFSKIKIEGFYSTDINYVHQLQNLYFILTGEELTIKEI